MAAAGLYARFLRGGRPGHFAFGRHGKSPARIWSVKSHIEVVPNGVDLKRFMTPGLSPRADFGFTDQDILLVYAGRIAPEKNLEFLLQSFAGVAQVLPECLSADRRRRTRNNSRKRFNT